MKNVENIKKVVAGIVAAIALLFAIPVYHASGPIAGLLAFVYILIISYKSRSLKSLMRVVVMGVAGLMLTAVLNTISFPYPTIVSYLVMIAIALRMPKM